MSDIAKQIYTATCSSGTIKSAPTPSRFGLQCLLDSPETTPVEYIASGFDVLLCNSSSLQLIQRPWIEGLCFAHYIFFPSCFEVNQTCYCFS
ncbi:unnamed protein product [Rhodiola kirilowii]